MHHVCRIYTGSPNKYHNILMYAIIIQQKSDIFKATKLRKYLPYTKGTCLVSTERISYHWLDPEWDKIASTKTTFDDDIYSPFIWVLVFFLGVIVEIKITDGIFFQYIFIVHSDHNQYTLKRCIWHAWNSDKNSDHNQQTFREIQTGIVSWNSDRNEITFRS